MPRVAAGAAADIARALTRAPRKDVVVMDGGLPAQSEPCEALSAHGYLGIEAQVVGTIVRWIRDSARG